MRLVRTVAVAALVAATVGCSTPADPAVQPAPDNVTHRSEQPRSTLGTTDVSASSQVTSEILDALSALDAEMGGEATTVTVDADVLFAFGSAQLTDDADSQLRELADILVQLDVRADVVGHTDSVGSDDVNDPLSQARADAVADRLVDHGVDTAQLTTDGAGSRLPVAPNTHPDGTDNPAGRAANRRVEIVLPPLL